MPSPPTDIGARTVGEHEHDGETREQRATSTSSRSRDSGSSQWQSSSTSTSGDSAARARRHSTSSPSSEVLRSFASNCAVRSLSGIGRSSSPAAAAPAARGRVDRRKLGFQGLHLRLHRQAPVEAEQLRPDLAPDEVARVCTVRLALAKRDENAALLRRARELGDEARLSHARLGGDRRRCARAPQAPRRALRPSSRAPPSGRRSGARGPRVCAVACRFDPVSTETATGSALPFTAIGGSSSHEKTSPAMRATFFAT